MSSWVRPPPSVAVVIPCYRVTRHVLGVIDRIGPEVNRIFCIDDGCPDGSGDFIEAHCRDPRVNVIRHAQNRGVGGAVMTGYAAAIAADSDVIVKIDGDGQMDPALLPEFVAPILSGNADYTKGNRFWELGEIRRMPPVRRVGNLGLSFMAKASSGYWDVFDPTNGYTAIHASVASYLPFDSISQRYFFETDILFRLNTLRATVKDIPMTAHYADETSHLKISKVIGEFAVKHVRNGLKRIGYSYFLRDMPVASIELAIGLLLLTFGVLFGGYHWYQSSVADTSTPVGTIMIATIAIISGLQFLLAFVSYDIANTPRTPMHPVIRRRPVPMPNALKDGGIRDSAG
ncbi:glycosyltransferase family 2 protein [Luteimonas sp. YGD11-2]|uniref:glycosyltransferase family 2 protein n=1 Tax=Luteimonas sp. YGD11-2 TaxID=2508168 RepID=UPI00100B0154|nr:glycosyltransferase family 2 protein [Luteimonas sp. YGD11-2]